ncbi:MAG: sigma 54-interacting transcriptional regulator [Gemmataceae bacterium]|nr:sigma 54-interacting transcriptional regulator [Gemmataceae bacterium]
MNRLLVRRLLFLIPGLVILAYALAILIWVQILPDLGLRTAFSTQLRDTSRLHYVEGKIPDRAYIARIGPLTRIETWVHVLKAPAEINRLRPTEGALADVYPSWAKRERVNGEREDDLIKIWLSDQQGGTPCATAWCVLGNIPFDEQIPSLLWFALKACLFAVGGLVFWKRPYDPAATRFYVLCVVTLGAYLGGYHWTNIATIPWMLLVFMVCAVMLPAVNLHFNLSFPRPKPFQQRHPWITAAAVYGVPAVFLAAMIAEYLLLRAAERNQDPSAAAYYGPLLTTIFVYFGVAAVWYLLSVAALLHSWRTVSDSTEKNQVKWIFFAAVLALVPISYSVLLAWLDPDAFSAGGATWPMFAVSVCFTVAFAVAITRYRLMELDKIISSSVGYFLVSFLAVVVYYFVGAVIFSRVLTGTSIAEVLTVSTTALLLMLVVDVFRSRLTRALDRRLSRNKTQLDRTLQRLSEAVEQLVDPPALAQKLLQATSDLLGVERGAVYLRDEDSGVYRLAGAIGQPPPLADLAPGFPLIDALHTGKPFVTASLGWTATAAHRQLQFLGGAIAQPVLQEDRLLAILILGPKATPYRTEEMQLLAAFAQITALALDSAAGHRTIEQLNRELQAKVQKIGEQQRRILSLQSQLRRQEVPSAAVGLTPPLASAPSDKSIAPPAGIVGSSAEMQQLLALVRKVAATDAVVLLRGESGTGKELLARAVHELSSRAAKPYVKVHCAALSPSLLESELFGHVKGAFTGAHRDKVGRFELANGGTLFLDEIGDISLEVQTKLLRVLQERTIERVGAAEPVVVDVRILAATHQDLEALIRQGRFREDLFYRLNVFPIRVPPLRERTDDIAELATHFVRLSAQRCRKPVVEIDDEVLALFKSYSWPGNIRQLENVIERAVVVCEGRTITLHELPPELFADHVSRPRDVVVQAADTVSLAGNHVDAPLGLARRYASLRSERERQERDELVRVLAAASGNKAEAARVLGVARSTLVSRLKKFGLS